jgi:hypothetical protein
MDYPSIRDLKGVQTAYCYIKPVAVAISNVR